MKTFVLSTRDGIPRKVFALPDEVDDSGPKLDKLFEAAEHYGLEVTEAPVVHCHEIEEAIAQIDGMHADGPIAATLTGKEFDRMFPNFDKTLHDIEEVHRLVQTGLSTDEAVARVVGSGDKER